MPRKVNIIFLNVPDGKKQCPLYEGTAFAVLLAEQGCDEPHG